MATKYKAINRHEQDASKGICVFSILNCSTTRRDSRGRGDAFYEALAWRGLEFENARDWSNLPQTEKERISKLGSRVEKFSRNAPCN